MLSIVVPVYNGADGLSALYGRIRDSLDSCSETAACGWELLFIDDGSTDGSMDEIRSICADEPRAGWVSFEKNCGQQAAVLCGLRLSRGDYIATIDDDLQHPPEVIPLMYKKAAEGWDAVYAAAETCSDDRASKRTGGLLRDLFFRLFLNKPAGLPVGSFRIFSRRAADIISEADRPFVYISAELFSARLPVSFISYRTEQFYVSGPRESRYSFRSRLKLYLKLLFNYAPVLRSIRFPVTETDISGPGGQYSIASRGGSL